MQCASNFGRLGQGRCDLGEVLERGVEFSFWIFDLESSCVHEDWSFRSWVVGRAGSRCGFRDFKGLRERFGGIRTSCRSLATGVLEFGGVEIDVFGVSIWIVLNLGVLVLQNFRICRSFRVQFSFGMLGDGQRYRSVFR